MKVIKVNTAKTSMTCPRPSDIYCYTSCHIGIYIRTYIYTGHNIDRYLNSNYSVNYDSGEKIANQINCLYSYQNYLAMRYAIVLIGVLDIYFILANFKSSNDIGFEHPLQII